MNESAWIVAAKRGDNDALAQLLQQHYLFVMKYLLQVTLHRQTAEDLTQETMIRAIEKIRLYDEHRSKFSTWLITIGSRLYLDQRRRQKKENQILSDEAVLKNLQWQIQSDGEEWPLLMETLVKLPETTRAAVVLKHYHGYAYEEIADILKVPVGTVKSRVHSGLTALRKEWLEHEERSVSR